MLAAVEATKNAVGQNTNLGTILLLAPIAGTDPTLPLDPQPILNSMTELDARLVYAAIRLANPGGLGATDQHDVHNVAPSNLLDAMRVAAPRDSIAAQYVTNFHDVRDRVMPLLQSGDSQGWSLNETIVYVHVQLMSEVPDSLIARKRGSAVAVESQRRAQRVLSAGRPGDSAYELARSIWILGCELTEMHEIRERRPI